LNNLYFVIGHGNARRKKDVSQILYQLGVEFAFLCFGIKTSFVKTLEYFFYMLVILEHVIRVDEYIIHESLEGCGSIGKTESVKIVDDGLNFYFHFHFLFYSSFLFLFLEQLGLGVISHAVTSVTT